MIGGPAYSVRDVPSKYPSMKMTYYTHTTCVRTLSTVYALMSHQIILLPKRLTTHYRCTDALHCVHVDVSQDFCAT